MIYYLVVHYSKEKAKNCDFTLKLFKNNSIKNLKKKIIGRNFPISNEDIIKYNIKYIDTNLDNSFINILKESKILFSSSIFDSSPNTVYNAIFNNIQVLIPENIDIPYLKK